MLLIERRDEGLVEEIREENSLCYVSAITQAPPLWRKVCVRSLCTTRGRLCFYCNRPLRELSGLAVGHVRVTAAFGDMTGSGVIEIVAE